MRPEDVNSSTVHKSPKLLYRIVVSSMAEQLLAYRIEYSGDSNVGYKRERNEDRFGCFGEGQFLAVADGMGGHRGGDVAAETTVSALRFWYERLEPTWLNSAANEVVVEAIKEAIKGINRAIYDMGRQELNLKGMGTTLCCLLFRGDEAIVCHVGDSRIYLYRKGELKQLTRDDSLVADLLDAGELDEEDISTFPYRGVLTRAIGMSSSINPHTHILKVEEGDFFLICSDGLTGMVPKQNLEQLLGNIVSDSKLEEGVGSLISAALEGGGDDNVTVVLARVHLS